jgi:hypothetical protein
VRTLGMAKYDPLARLLRRSEPPLTLTFAELDALIGGLPASAREHPSWWGNTVNESHVHANAWVASGWLAHADLQNEVVRFVKGEVQRGTGGGKGEPKSKSVLCRASSLWVPPDVECDYCGEVHRALPAP